MQVGGRKSIQHAECSRSQGRVTAYISILRESDLRMLTTYYGAAEKSTFWVWLVRDALAGLAADSDGARIGFVVGERLWGLLAKLVDMEDEAFDSPEQRATYC